MPDPSKLGKYQILGKLGKGGMGAVYKAFDPIIQRPVALKTIRKELLDEVRGADLIARFKNEAQAAGRLNHPGIVAIYDYGEDENVAYIAMEYVEDCGLHRYFSASANFPMADIVSIIVQLLDALASAHEQGIVHRDIKPANIMITKGGKVKIADFGIARVDTSNLTQLGAIIGTPGYMAPEQFMGKPTDKRVDLFAAGVVFYELLTGSKPFEGGAATLAYKVCHEDERRPSEVNTALPAAFDAVVRKALAKNPDERYADARSFSDAVQEVFRKEFHDRASPVLSEETVLYPAHQRGDSPDPPAAPLSAASACVESPLPLSSNWRDDTLRTIEHQLAMFIGPLAKIIVRNAAARTQDIDELYALLATKLDNADARTAFLHSRPGIDATRPPVAPSSRATAAADSATPAEPIAPQAVERAARLLAKSLGPIANVIAGKAARKAAGLPAFYALLAEQIADDDDRRRFLHEIGSHQP